ncbi:MAG TPA: ABC transporter ATP-binding protein [Acetobacteraceae bacterium]|nr:ABC transporter ATP-binding protein [Acetobacteraceae bacterium]
MFNGRPLAFIFAVIKRRKISHIIILLSVLTAVVCSVGTQYAVKNLVDVLAHDEKSSLWIAFGFLAGLIALDNAMWRIGGWVASRSFVAVTGDIRRKLFNHMLGHAPAYFSERRPGMMAGRISATGNAVYRIESLATWNVLPPLFAVTGSIIMLGTVDPLMSLALVGVALTLGAVLAWLARAGRPLHQNYASAAAAVDGELVDIINNVNVVRAFGAIRRERRRFAGDVRREMTARRQSLRYLEKLRMLHAGVTALLTACLLAWTLLRWEHGQATPGDVVLVTTLGFTVLHGTRDLAVALVEMVQDYARLTDALNALLVPHDMPDTPASRVLKSPKGAVSFSRVNFNYPDSPVVLRDFSLQIAPGERVGLVGRSGSGKSTVLGLLQRLFDVQEGQVLIDGEPVGDLTQLSLTSAISVVSQDVQLFQRSVLENIRYGRPGATDEEVRAAAEAAEADEFIRKLPQGYDTLVGERGLKLSGGQRQRLAIARAFLRDAPILLLDEATSALDSESEQAVQEALNRLAHGRTVIAVAHRLSTLRDFDRIVVMDAGRIVEEGRPADLERRGGAYRELMNKQGLRLIKQAA